MFCLGMKTSLMIGGGSQFEICKFQWQEVQGFFDKYLLDYFLLKY